MNTRELQKIIDEKSVADYEHNIKLHYDAMTNELNTIIRNTIPKQMDNIKTLMWINVIFLGMSLQLKDFNYWFYILFCCIFVSFAYSFYAMTFGRSILYGNSQKITFMIDVKSGLWCKTHGIYRMMQVVQRTIRYNGMIVIKRSRHIRNIVVLTVISLWLFGMCVVSTSGETKWQKHQYKDQQLQHQEVVAKEVDLKSK